MATTTSLHVGFELRFDNLLDEGRGLTFPCDDTGSVDMDALTDRARNNYFCARALVGRDYATPVVRQLLTATR